MQLWNKQKTSVFANSWRRSRVILIDELFKPELCETIPKSAVLRMPSFLESRNCLSLLWTSLERKWSQPTFSSMAIGRFLNRELRHQEGATSWCSARQNWSTERAFHSPQYNKNFDGIHDRFLKHSTYLDSQLKIGWTEETCIAMNKLAQENHSFCPLLEEFERYRKNGISHWTNQEDMHQWNSDQTSEKHSQICTVSTVNLEKSELNQFLVINTKGGIRRLLHPVPHGGSGMNTGGAHKLKNVNYLWAHGMSSIKEQGDLFWTLTHQDTQSVILFYFLNVVRSFTGDRNLLQPTGGVNRTPSHLTFSRVSQHTFQCRTWHWSCVLRARHPCIIRMVLLFCYSSTLHSALFTVSLIFLFILLIFIFIFHVGWFDEKSHVFFREWGFRHFGREQSSHTSRGLSTTSQTPSSWMTEISSALAFSTGCCWAACHSCHRCDPIRTHRTVKGRYLGLLTHWLVSATLVHACNVAITLLKDEQINFTDGSSSLCHNSASEFIAELSTSESLGSLSAMRLRAVRLSKSVSAAPSSICSASISADLLRITGASWPEVCISVSPSGFESKRSWSENWTRLCWPEPLELLGVPFPESSRSFRMRSACLTRVALTRVAVDSSAVIASSSRFLHSAVCSCTDIGNLAQWTSQQGIPPCNQTFQNLLCGCRHCGFLCCRCVGFGWIGLTIRQRWRNQHCFGQTCRNIARIRLKAFHGHSAAICGRIAALLCFVSRIEQHRSQFRPWQCAQLLSLEHPQTHLWTISCPAYAGCVFGCLRTRQNSASQLSRACLWIACRLCDHRVAHFCGRVGEDWNNAEPTRPTNGLRDSRVIPDWWTARSTSPLLLLSPLGDASESCRANHSWQRHRGQQCVAPDLTWGWLSCIPWNPNRSSELSQDMCASHPLTAPGDSRCLHSCSPGRWEHWECVMCFALRSPEKRIVHGGQSVSVLPRSFRVNFAMAQ